MRAQKFGTRNLTTLYLFKVVLFDRLKRFLAVKINHSLTYVYKIDRSSEIKLDSNWCGESIKALYLIWQPSK